MLLNNNQLGIVARFNSGFRVNVRSNVDLNRDRIATNDRSLFIGRNTETTGTVKQIDLRYSRFIPIREALRLEIIGEFTNLFNMVYHGADGGPHIDPRASGNRGENGIECIAVDVRIEHPANGNPSVHVGGEGSGCRSSQKKLDNGFDWV